MKGKSCLIFFGDSNNSKFGTIRSLVAYLMFMMIFLVLYLTNKKVRDINIFLVALILVFFVSILTIQVPYDSSDSIKYGLSLGFYTFGLFLITYYILNKKITTEILLYSIGGIISFCLVSLTVYKISSEKNWYPNHC
jgi:hypothetical protein